MTGLWTADELAELTDIWRAQLPFSARKLAVADRLPGRNFVAAREKARLSGLNNDAEDTYRGDPVACARLLAMLVRHHGLTVVRSAPVVQSVRAPPLIGPDAQKALALYQNRCAEGQEIYPSHVVGLAAELFEVSIPLIKGVARYRNAMLARRYVAIILRDGMGWSTPRIGKLLNKDHSSIVHALRDTSRAVLNAWLGERMKQRVAA